MPADQADFDGALGLASIARLEKGPPLIEAYIARSPVTAVAVSHASAMGAAGNFQCRRIVGADDQRTVGGNDIDQSAKGRLHMVDIAVDIRVIEIDAGKNHIARPVMKQLSTPIAKKRVVLIDLH